MKKTELKPWDVKPYDDSEEIKKQAEKFIECILICANYFEHSVRIRPTVFMSHDMLSTITKGKNEAVTCHKYGEPLKVCGYDLKLVLDKNVLYLGYNISDQDERSRR